MNEEKPLPDPPLTQEQIKLVSQLSEEQIKDIDDALMSEACDRWRKIARIVGTMMMNFPNRVHGIPDVFYSQRVRLLVEKGLLESQGNLAYMCFSEVRLPKNIENSET